MVKMRRGADCCVLLACYVAGLCLTTDLDEAVHLLVEIWGQDLLDSDDESIRETVAAFATISYHGRIDRKVFCEFTEKNPTLLMPAYAFQRMVRAALCAARCSRNVLMHGFAARAPTAAR